MRFGRFAVARWCLAKFVTVIDDTDIWLCKNQIGSELPATVRCSYKLVICSGDLEPFIRSEKPNFRISVTRRLARDCINGIRSVGWNDETPCKFVLASRQLAILVEDIYREFSM